MADLSVQAVAAGGLEPAYTAAASGGDTLSTDGNKTFLHAKNGSAGSITVTVAAATVCNFGETHDLAVAIPAGEERMIGPLSTERFGASAAVTYSGVTSLTVAAIKV